MKHLEPFTKKQLLERALQSNKDYSEGGVKIQKQLVTESEMVLSINQPINQSTNKKREPVF